VDASVHLEQVGHLLQEAVEGSDLPASFRSLLALPLRQAGKLLGGEPQPRWPAVVLASCAATGGNERGAVTVAAAVELFIAALDVLDDVEDGDPSPLVAAAGVPQALNVSTALLMLAYRLLGQLSDDGVAHDLVARQVYTMAQAGLTATIGQHRDLAVEGAADLSTEDALDIARQKAGALLGGACRLGALLGTTDEELLALYEAWGRHYGTAAQLANDFHDVEETSHKSDRRRSKGTLPLLYALHAADAAGARPPDLAASGAMHFTWAIYQLERRAGDRVMAELARRGQEVSYLQSLVS
jgi:geranylgeranyl pyrophosphate synthase